MKKLLAVLFVAAVMVAGLFAEEFPKGTWTDPNYDAEWVIGLDMKIDLYDATDGSLIYSFTKDKIQDQKLDVTKEGLVYQFSCKETHRKYYFIKPAKLVPDANLVLKIDPDWTTEDYKVDIKFKK